MVDNIYMTRKRLIPTLVLIGALALTGCDSDGEIKGINRFLPEETTTTSSTINPYLKPPSRSDGKAPNPDNITRTTLSYNTDDCKDRDVSDDEPDVFEEFCDE